MTTSVIYYDNTTGQIVKAGGVQDSMIDANKPAGTTALTGEVADASTQYVSGGVVTARPEMSLSTLPTVIDVDEEFVVTGVPVGTVCHHVDGTTTINDGSLEWESDTAGVFTFRLLNFPHQEVTFHVKVEA